MGFLAPIMLAGVAAIAVPIAIHLIGRRKARVVKFAALDFLLATKRRTARRLRLRERFFPSVLACRAIACAPRSRSRSPSRTRRASAAAPRSRVARRPPCSSSTTRSRRGSSSTAGHVAQDRRRRARPPGPRSARPGGRGRDRARHGERRPPHRAHARPPQAARPAARARAERAARRHDACARGGGAAARVIEPQPQDGVPAVAAREDRAARRAGVGIGWPRARRRRAAAEPAREPRRHRAARRDPAGRGDARARVRRRGRRNFSPPADPGAPGTDAATIEPSLSIADRVVAKGRLDVPPGEHRTKRFLATLPAGVRAADSERPRPAATRFAIDDCKAGCKATLRDEVQRAARRRRPTHGAPRRRAVLPRGRAAPGRSRRHARRVGPPDHHRRRSAAGVLGHTRPACAPSTLAGVRRRRCSRTCPRRPSIRSPRWRAGSRPVVAS